MSATRSLRSEIVALAMAVGETPHGTHVLRLISPRLSAKRIEEEWRRVSGVLRPAVSARLSLHVVFPDGHSLVLGAPVTGALEAAGRPARPGTLRLGRRDLSFAVEKALIWGWLTGKGPMTRSWLERAVGCAYPTVAAVVKRLGSALVHHRDRRIEVNHLPREEWGRFFALSGSARSVLRFADRSDQPTSAAELLDRLFEQMPPGVGVGGVAAARHYSPDLDMLGLPRLDLSVHAPSRDVDVGFVKRLDPALKVVTALGEPVILALHFVRHADPLFASGDGLPWADPVECLLDLTSCRQGPGCWPTCP